METNFREAESQPNKSKVKYSHFREGPHGVTIARIFDKESGIVSYGWAANVPPKKHQYLDEAGNIKVKTNKGDNFCRRSGRAIALGRLESRPIKVKVSDDTLPIVLVLEHMENNLDLPFHVRYLAAYALDEEVRCYTYGELKMKRDLVDSAKPTSFLDRFVNWMRGAND